jgi:hypothetical protein
MEEFLMVTIAKKHAMLREALKLARRGFAVFPCAPRAKHPITPHGCKDATTDREVIRHWWGTEPTANIGLATGALSGIFVLDVDPGHGGAESLAALQAAFGKLPPTVVNLTGGGGQHLLFRHPQAGGRKVRNLVGFYDGLDVRGDGGYILAPPSVHPNGRQYRWETPGRAIAPAPEWLTEIVLEPNRELRGPTEGRTTCHLSARYAAAAVRSACEAIASSKPGERNSTLNVEAFGIGQLVGAGVLDIRDAAMSLTEAAFECGLGREEIERTLQSGLLAGMVRPREMSDV